MTEEQLLSSERLFSLFKFKSKEDAAYMYTYGDDVIQNLFNKESKCFFFDYMEKQKELTIQRFKILVDWVVDTVDYRVLSNRILHDTVYILHKYFSKKNVKLSNLGVVAVAVLVITTKFDRSYRLLFTGYGYEIHMLKDAEQFILETIGFSVNTITTFDFLEIYSNMDVGPIEKNMMFYLATLALTEYDLQRYRPSMIAAAIVSVVRKTLWLNPLPLWIVRKIFNCDRDDALLTGIEVYLQILHTTTFYQIDKKATGSIFDMYSKKKYKQVALINPTRMFCSVD